MKPEDVKILLVEDSTDDIALTRRVLKKNGLDLGLAMATDGKSAMDLLKTMAESRSRLPNMILLDINLPDISGLDLLTKIKGDPRFAEIPVIMLTGSNTDNYIQRSYDLGASTYLIKPISTDALMLVVKNLFSDR